MSYNGYENYETWAVMLWINNSEGDQDYWREQALEVWGDPDNDDDDGEPLDERSRTARIDLSNRLKDSFEEAMPDHSGTIWGDLLTSALGSVDWYEIADALLSSADLEGYKDRNAA